MFSKYTYDSAATLGTRVPVPARALCPVFSKYTYESAVTLGTRVAVPARTLCPVFNEYTYDSAATLGTLYLYLQGHCVQCLVSSPMLVQLDWEPCTCT